MKRISTSLSKARSPRTGGVLLALATLLIVVGVAVAAAPPAIDRWVIAGGGGHVEAPPSALSGTLGQAVVGVTGRGPFGLCAGFWCRPVGPWHAIYLPMVLRDF